MATRAERILDQASAYSANFEARRSREDELRRDEMERVRRDELATRAQSEAKRNRKITELWKSTGIIELFQELAELKGWEVSFASEDEVRLGYTSETSVGGMEQGDCGRYSDSVFHCIVDARRDVRERWFRSPERRWFINDKQVGVDGSLEDLVAEAIAYWQENNKEAEDYSRFGPGDWDCWKP